MTSDFRCSPAQTEGDFHGVLVISRLVKVLQSVHALVPAATARIAVVQHRFQQHSALGIVSETRMDETRRGMDRYAAGEHVGEQIYTHLQAVYAW